MVDGEPVAVCLMNTIWADTSGVHDDLSTTAGLRAWLQTADPDARYGRINRADLQRARALRDALRRLAASVSDDDRRAAQSPLTDLQDATSVVNELAVQAPRELLTVRNGRPAPAGDTTTSPVTAALVAVAVESIALFTDADTAPLGACRAPGCVRYFGKTHPRREWCSEACGNRVRAARRYRRIRSV